MSIDKNKLRAAVNKMKREAVTSHKLWNPLKNSFVKVFRMQNITLEVIRETIYNFWIVFKDIRNWSEVSELADIVNRYLSDVVGKDILTEDSFNLYEKAHPPRLNESKSESEDELPLNMAAVTTAATSAAREYRGETKSSISPGIDPYMADLLRQAREYDLRKYAEQRERNNPANMLRQTSLSEHPDPKEVEVLTALLGSDEYPNPQNVEDIEHIMSEHLVKEEESERWDRAAKLAKRKRYEKEGRLDELGGGKRKTFLRKRSQKRKKRKQRKTKRKLNKRTRRRPFFKKGRKNKRKTRKRKTFLRKRSQKRKKRKRRKTKRKLNKRSRRRGGDLPLCASFVPGGYDNVYSTHGGIFSGYIKSDSDCQQRRGANFLCNAAKIAADPEQFQRRNLSAKGRLYFTNERRHKNLKSSCKLGQCCEKE